MIFLGKKKTIRENEKSSILCSENLADFGQYFNLAPIRGPHTHFTFDNTRHMPFQKMSLYFAYWALAVTADIQ